MSTSLPTTIRRILLALGEENDMASAFEFTASLAQVLDAELRGLYVEDADLLRLAGLPFARETGTTTAVVRRLQGPDIERGWQRQAVRLQKNLAEVAARRQLRWSFQVVRGRMTTHVVEEATTTDLVAVTSLSRTSGETLQTLDCPLLILPTRPALGSAVGVLVDGSPTSELALRFAVALMPEDGSDCLRIFTVAGQDMRRVMEKRAERILSDAGVHTRAITLAAADATALTHSLRIEGTRTLVVAAADAAQSLWLRPLLEKPPCAAWLVR